MKSFDLFDTLITRDLYHPSDIFYFVGKKAKKLDLIEIEPNNFTKYRINAEIITRKKSIFEEVNLDEIYNELNLFLRLDIDKLNKIKNIEVNTELESFCVIYENYQKMDQDSIIISDMYHSKKTLELVLNNLNIPNKEIFVSSEYRKLKHYGGLYDIVLKKYNLLQHVGDNYHSDFVKANEKKIKASLYEKSKPSIYERLINSSQLSFEQKALLSGTMKSNRLSKSYDDIKKQTIHDVSSNVIAPFLFLYVDWIMHKAIHEKLDLLCFVARDGQILYKIANIIKNKQQLDIEIKYLYGSRKAWHLPSTFEIDENTLNWIFDPTYILTIEDICNRVEINVDEINFLLTNKYECNKNLSIIEREHLRKEFKDNKKIHSLILEKSKEKRVTLIEYLKQEGFSENINIGIVDVGWRARQQFSLSKILHHANIYPLNGIYGFYLSLMNPINPINKDKYYTFFDAEQDKDIIGYGGLYESFVAADHGSCISYKYCDELVVPVLREERNINMINWGLEIQHDSIELFSKKIVNSSIKYDIKFDDHKLFSKLILNKFLKSPSLIEAKVFGSIKMFEDQDEKNHHSHCIKISYFDILKILISPRYINHNIWIEGSVVYSFSHPFSKLFLNLFYKRKKVVYVIKKIFNNIKSSKLVIKKV